MRPRRVILPASVFGFAESSPRSPVPGFRGILLKRFGWFEAVFAWFAPHFAAGAFFQGGRHPTARQGQNAWADSQEGQELCRRVFYFKKDLSKQIFDCGGAAMIAHCHCWDPAPRPLLGNCAHPHLA